MAPKGKGKGKNVVKAPSPAPAVPPSESGYHAKGRGPASASAPRTTRSSKGTSLPAQAEIISSAVLPSIFEGDEEKAMQSDEIQGGSSGELDVEILMRDTGNSFGSDYPEVDDDAVYGDPFIPVKDLSSESSESLEILPGDDDFIVEDVPTGQGASTSRGATARGRGCGRGRPRGTSRQVSVSPATNPVPASFELMFTINLGGKSELFKMKSSSTIFDLRDKVADLAKKRNHELELLYTTCWGKRSDRFQLNGAEEWKQLLAFAGVNLTKRKTTYQYHVEIYDGLTKPVGKAKAGKAGTSGVGNCGNGDQDGDGSGAPGFDSATAALTQIQAAHACKKHGYECYVVKNNLYEPKFKKNEHIRYPFPVMLEWADECVTKPDSPARAVPTTVPEKYIPRILRVEPLSDEEDEDGLGALRVPDKARGRTGPHPKAEELANPPPGASYPAPPAPLAPMWPPYPYPPYPMPPSYGHPYQTPAYPPPSASPVRTFAKGPRLSEWLRGLEEELESDEESYLDLLPALKREGVHRVKDFALWNAADLRESVGCSLGVAKRILNEARIAMRQ